MVKAATMAAFRLAWTLLLYCAVALQAAPTLKEKSHVKIVGGVPAVRGEYPFIVSVQNRAGTHLCGATIYNLSHVVTTASCASSGSLTSFQVVAGAYTTDELQQGQQQSRRVKKITKHPSYEFLDKHNDIAVMELAEPFNETEYIKPIILANRSQQEYSGNCIIAGWGSIGKSSPDRMYKGNVTVYSRSYCKNAYPEYMETLEICANGRNEQGEVVEACQGDAGGPLVCTDTQGKFYLAGVSAYGWMCGDEAKPGVYMEISKYREWLEATILGTGYQGESDGEDEAVGTTTTIQTSTTTKKVSSSYDDGIAGVGAEAEVAVGDQQGNKPIQTGCGQV